MSRAGDRPPDMAAYFPFREFFALDLRSLALFRVCIAVMVLLDWYDRLPDLGIMYSDDGLLPRPLLQGQLIPVSAHMLSGAWWWQAALAALAMWFGLMLLVGWLTPLATFMSFFLLISVHARNPGVIQGSDQLMRAVLLWGTFLPLGACWSVDSCGAGRQAKEKSVLSFASFVFIGQIFIMYLFAAAWKWLPEWREKGTAVLLALQVESFSTRFGKLMRESHTLCYWMTQLSVWLETVGPVVLLLPFHVGLQRLAVIFLFVMFHAGLGLSLELSLFPWIACAIWMALIPTSFWDRLERHWKTPGLDATRIVYDPERPWAARAAHVWRTFLLFGAGAIEAATGGLLQRVRTQGGWAVVGADGAERTGGEAVVHAFRLSPIFSPLAWVVGAVPGLAGLLAALTSGYGGAKAAEDPKQGEPGWAPPAGPLAVTLLMLMFGYVLLYNLRNIGSEYMHPTPSGMQRPADQYTPLNRFFEEAIPIPFLQFGSVSGLEQGWGVFAPRPARHVGWYYAAGTLADGSRVELLMGGTPPSLDQKQPPENYQATFKNGRWRKYTLNLAAKELTPFALPGYIRWAYKDWNARHTGPKQMVKLEVYYVKLMNLNPDDPVPDDQGKHFKLAEWPEKPATEEMIRAAREIELLMQKLQMMKDKRLEER